MQQRAILLALAALLAAPAASLSAASQARLFLRRHAGTAPGPDELAELKGVNPEAYALVKALLTKRSLGLLNARHPTASFAAPAKEEDAAERGPEVFAKFASPDELKSARVQRGEPATEVAMPYAEVQPAAHKDWLNWKPQSAAMDDETMVNNVLGAVAELKGKKTGLLSKHHSSSESSLSADEESFNVAPAEVAPAKPAAPPAAPQENSYLKSIDFGIKTPEAPKPEASAPHENSYLKGIDLTGDVPKSAAQKQTSQVQSSSENSLSSFSWDDSKPQEAAPQPQVVQPAAQPKGNNFLGWLGLEKKPAAPKVVAAPAKASNPYLMDLS